MTILRTLSDLFALRATVIVRDVEIGGAWIALAVAFVVWWLL